MAIVRLAGLYFSASTQTIMLSSSSFVKAKIVSASSIFASFKISSSNASPQITIDEDNIMVCVLAEKYSPAKRTIAIVNKSNYSLLQKSLNIDDLVDPRMTTVSRIMEHIHKGTIETVYSVLDGEYEFIEAEILEKSELLNKSIKNSNLPEHIRIGAILRDKKVIIPKTDFVFEKDDLVVFLAKRELIQEVESIFRLSSI